MRKKGLPQEYIIDIYDSFNYIIVPMAKAAKI